MEESCDYVREGERIMAQVNEAAPDLTTPEGRLLYMLTGLGMIMGGQVAAIRELVMATQDLKKGR